MNKVVTLGQFIIEKANYFPYAKGELSRLLRDIGIASKIVKREVNKAGLVDILGDHGTMNSHGEDRRSLDMYANDNLFSALIKEGSMRLASEKMRGFAYQQLKNFQEAKK